MFGDDDNDGCTWSIIGLLTAFLILSGLVTALGEALR